MKIAGLKTFVVANPPPRRGGRYFIFLKLVTDNGIEGVGEVYNATFAPDVIVKMIEDVFQRNVEGMDPFRIEQFWRRAYARGYSMRPDISLVGVMSGIEMALWDICGKAVDKPVYELLGGRVHERLRSYTYLYAPADVDAYAYTDEGNKVYYDPMPRPSVRCTM
jgi:galactonate dehydratase